MVSLRRGAPLMALLTLAACGLPAGVVYQCDEAGGCARPGYVCQDGLCVPPALQRDAGAVVDAGPDGGPADDGGVADAGVTDAGSDDGGTPDAGSDDAGAADAGVPDDGGSTGDAGLPACDCALVACGFTPQAVGCTQTFCGYCGPGEHCGETTPNTCGAVSLATAGGWRWEHPLPQGNTLNAAWVQHRRSVFFVGNAATVLHFDGERFSLMPVPVGRTVDLLAVHGTGSDVWAVGTGGVILRLVGQAWVEEPSGTSADLFTVAAFRSSGTALAIAGGAGGVLRRRTTSWNTVSPALPEDVAALAVDGAGIVRALTAWTGRVYRSSALSMGSFGFTHEATLGTFGLALVAAGGEWYALGESQRPDGGWRSAVAVATGGFDGGQALRQLERPFQGMAAEANGAAVYLVGWGLDFARFRRDGGVETLPNSGDDSFAVAVIEPEHVLTAGSRGVLGVCRPPCTAQADWLELSSGALPHLRGLCGLTEESLVAYGNGWCGSACGRPVMERRATATGTRWEATWQGVPSSSNFVACATPSATDTWVFAEGGEGFRRRGTTWATTPSFVGDAGVRAAFFHPQRQALYALAREKALYKTDLDGGVLGLGTYTQGFQYALWFTGDKFLSVGEGGDALFIDHGPPDLSDSYLPSPRTQRDLHGATLADGGYLFISAGDDGSVAWRVYADTSFSLWAGAPVLDYTGAWVHGSGRAWLSARRGEVVRLTAAASVALTPPTREDLADVWGVALPDGGARLWVVGANGVILRKDE